MTAATKVQPQGSCRTCDEMWREYAHAMAEYLKIRLDLYMATTARNWDEEAALHERLVEAEGRRESARLVVRQHEDATHQP